MNSRSCLSLLLVFSFVMRTALAQAALPCEWQLTDLDESKLDAKQVSRAIMLSIETLDDGKSFTQPDILELIRELAASEDSLTLSETFQKTHSQPHWMRVERLLDLIKPRVMAREDNLAIQVQLKSDLQILADERASRGELSEVIPNQWTVSEGYRVIDHSFLNSTSLALKMRALKLRPSTLVISYNDFTDEALLDFSDGKHVREIPIPSSGRPNMLYLSESLRRIWNSDPVLHTDILAYDFSNLDNPILYSLAEASKKSGLLQDLMGLNSGVRLVYEISPTKALLFVGLDADSMRGNILTNKIFAVDTLQKQVDLLFEAEKPFLVSNVLKISDNEMFLVGDVEAIGKLSFSDLENLKSFKFDWAHPSLDLPAESRAANKAIRLKSGNVLTYASSTSSKLYHWNLHGETLSAPTLISDKNPSLGSMVLNVFELHPDQILTIETGPVAKVWDISNLEDISPKELPGTFPEFCSVKMHLQLGDGSLLGCDVIRNEITYIRLGGNNSFDILKIPAHFEKDNAQFVSSSNWHMLELQNGDALIFYGHGSIVYVTLGEHPEAFQLKSILGNPLRDGLVQDVVELPNGNVVALNRARLIVEFDLKAISKIVANELH